MQTCSWLSVVVAVRVEPFGSFSVTSTEMGPGSGAGESLRTTTEIASPSMVCPGTRVTLRGEVSTGGGGGGGGPASPPVVLPHARRSNDARSSRTS